MVQINQVIVITFSNIYANASYNNDEIKLKQKKNWNKTE